MQWHHLRNLALALAFAVGTAEFSFAQTGLDGATSPGGAPRPSTGETPNPPGRSTPQYGFAPGQRGFAPGETEGRGVGEKNAISNGRSLGATGATTSPTPPASAGSQ